MLDGPVHKGIFPCIRPLPPTPNFQLMIYPAEIEWQIIGILNPMFIGPCIIVIVEE